MSMPAVTPVRTTSPPLMLVLATLGFMLTF